MGAMPVWAFVGGVLLIGTTIGLIASTMFWLILTGGGDGEEEEER